MMPAAMVKLQSCNRHGGALKLHRRGAFGEVSNALLQPVSPANPSIEEGGTELAISYLHLGVAPLLPCSTGRGGARNRADRESHALTAAHIANLSAAKRHAAAMGLPFTRMLTIHWKAAGVPLSGMVRANGRFTDLLTKFLARHGTATTWLWTNENGPGKGWHCHILAHVPAALVDGLVNLQRGWLRSITGNPYRASVIKSEPDGGRLGLERGNPDLHAVNLEVAFGYVCKGAPQAVLDAAGIDRMHEPGGRVLGKRCGTSQNIGATARSKAMTDG